jgi:anti-sigma B factor antagonist
MEVYAKRSSDLTVLTLTGSIDAFTAPKITEFINSQITNGNIKLVADFSGVDYTSSAGLRMLLGAIKETRPRGGDLRLVAVQPNVLKVLTLSGFTNILKIFDNTEAALESYS